MTVPTTSDRTLPQGPDGITPQWLTGVLRDAGVIQNASVSDVDAKVIGAGAGFMGRLVHLGLQYDKQEDGAPASLVAKLPAGHPENREVAMFFRFYEREVRFYEQVAGAIDMRIPRCYYSHFDPDTGDYVLLIEDLAPAVVGDQLAGCSVEQADLAINELAKLHAAWWDSPKLEQLEWLPRIDADWYIQAVEEGYADAWEPYYEHFGRHLLTPYMRDVGKRFPSSIRPLMTRFGAAPRTVVHGDYRLDNLFFGPPGHRDPLCVIDWQISTRARGTFDLAYFTCGTLPPEDRKKAEMDLLERYHGLLTERGVTGYTLDQCREDYRASTLFCWVYSVIGIGALDLANQRGVDVFTAISQRTAAAIEDLDAAEFLV